MIGLHHERHGHPLHPDVPFLHECTDHCGEHALDDHMGDAHQERLDAVHAGIAAAIAAEEG